MFGYNYNNMRSSRMAMGMVLALAYLVAVSTAVRITNLKVPSTYLLGHPDNAEHLVLDCEYEVGADEETGFVLKWWLNEHQIYQWIPKNHHPHSMPSPLKSFINLNYTASPKPLHKYRALAIARPSVNMTGTYTCQVSTYKSEDKRSAALQIIHPESKFSVDVKESKRDGDTLQVRCNAVDVFPEPRMTVLIGEVEQAEFTIDSKRDTSDGLYDVAVFGTVLKTSISDPSDVDCFMSIPGTNYTNRIQASDISSSSHPTVSAVLMAACMLLASAALRV